MHPRDELNFWRHLGLDNTSFTVVLSYSSRVCHFPFLGLQGIYRCSFLESVRENKTLCIIYIKNL
jgi:hypothetical protein